MKREIIFAPEPLPSNEPSLVLGLQMGGILIDVCGRFLFDAAFQDSVVAVTDRHTQNLWERELATSATTVIAHNRDVLKPGSSYIYMSNHQSLLDIPVLFACVPGSLRMVTKAELFKVPVLGQALDRAGFIMIERNNREKAIAQLEKAKDRIREGISVWIAPEGTRSRDPERGLQPFKKGGFHTAISLETPIVPMWIEGASQVLFAGSSEIHPNKTVNVYFGEPIPTQGLSVEALEELMSKVRQAMETLREKAQN